MFPAALPLYKGEASGGGIPSSSQRATCQVSVFQVEAPAADEGESSEQPASNGSARGRRRHPGSSPSTCDGNYRRHFLVGRPR
jgi:hypothetical protein